MSLLKNESAPLVRTYGDAPFHIVLVHGGPGVAGDMAPLASLLAPEWGILEPLQTATSVAGQAAELKAAIESYGDVPVILVGFSWGAWLCLLVAAQNPNLVRKLILIGCGPLEEDLAARVPETRIDRLGEEDRMDFIMNLMTLSDPEAEGKDAALARLGKLVAKTDACDPLPTDDNQMDYRGDIFQKVWTEAAEMRRSGKLLELAERVRCPVVAIHGDYDPHPAEGVQPLLAASIQDFHFILLEKCGHKPWIERQARDKFLTMLREELNSDS
ncbi:MAG: alpha/beta hydrolase [Syntrophaceae bacterium]|nr:alpha/beta hydrolase [Syntrophaceae bacterium]